MLTADELRAMSLEELRRFYKYHLEGRPHAVQHQVAPHFQQVLQEKLKEAKRAIDRP